MNLPKLILVPTDFSDGADHALRYAIRLSKVFGARISVLHTYTLPVLGLPDASLAMTADVVGIVTRGAEEAMSTLIASYARENVELRPLVKVGDARDLIPAVAKEVGADLICMGTHGRSGLKRLLLGSVAEAVVRTSSVPVLTVRNEQRAATTAVAAV